jgi:hypothetical protein
MRKRMISRRHPNKYQTFPQGQFRWRWKHEEGSHAKWLSPPAVKMDSMGLPAVIGVHLRFISLFLVRKVNGIGRAGWRVRQTTRPLLANIHFPVTFHFSVRFGADFRAFRPLNLTAGFC